MAKTKTINSDNTPNSGTDGVGVERSCDCGVETLEAEVASIVPFALGVLEGGTVIGKGVGVSVIGGVGPVVLQTGVGGGVVGIGEGGWHIAHG